MRREDRYAEPSIDERGVPFCSEDCWAHDGKRCELMGWRPGHLCEPEVAAMADIIKLAGLKPERAGQ